MTKKINFNALKKEVALYDKKEKIQLDDQFHIHIYPLFAPSKIQQMLTEALEDHTKAIEAGLGKEMVNLLDWILFHMILHFTDLDIPTELNLKLQAFAILRDSKYFNKIVNSFPAESMDQVMNTSKKMIDTLKHLVQVTENEIEDTNNIDQPITMETEKVPTLSINNLM